MKEEAEARRSATAYSAFLLQSATPTTTRHGRRSRGRSIQIHYPGQPAVMMVGGIEWTSKIPRNQIECDQVNAWAAKVISQNAAMEPPMRKESK